MEMLHRSFITPIDRGDIHRSSTAVGAVGALVAQAIWG